MVLPPPSFIDEHPVLLRSRGGDDTGIVFARIEHLGEYHAGCFRPHLDIVSVIDASSRLSPTGDGVSHSLGLGEEEEGRDGNAFDFGER